MALAVIPNEDLAARVEHGIIALAVAAQCQQARALPKPAEPTAIPSDEQIDRFIAKAGVSRTWDRLTLAIA
jgi:hypothetical protein